MGESRRPDRHRSVPSSALPELVGSTTDYSDEWSEIGDLLEVARRRPAWHADACCKEAPPEVSWFVEPGEDPEPARAVCRRCLVASECRTWSLAQGPALKGIWGGLTAHDRTAIRRVEAA